MLAMSVVCPLHILIKWGKHSDLATGCLSMTFRPVASKGSQYGIYQRDRWPLILVGPLLCPYLVSGGSRTLKGYRLVNTSQIFYSCALFPTRHPSLVQCAQGGRRNERPGIPTPSYTLCHLTLWCLPYGLWAWPGGLL